MLCCECSSIPKQKKKNKKTKWKKQKAKVLLVLVTRAMEFAYWICELDFLEHNNTP